MAEEKEANPDIGKNCVSCKKSLKRVKRYSRNGAYYCNIVCFKKKDAEVMSIFKEVFPEQKIRQLNPVTINHSGGGFHCYSYNEPRIN